MCKKSNCLLVVDRRSPFPPVLSEFRGARKVAPGPRDGAGPSAALGMHLGGFQSTRLRRVGGSRRLVRVPVASGAAPNPASRVAGRRTRRSREPSCIHLFTENERYQDRHRAGVRCALPALASPGMRWSLLTSPISFGAQRQTRRCVGAGSMAAQISRAIATTARQSQQMYGPSACVFGCSPHEKPAR